MIAKVRLIFAAIVLLATSLAGSAQIDPTYEPEAGNDPFVDNAIFVRLTEKRVFGAIIYYAGSRFVKILPNGDTYPGVTCESAIIG